MLFPAKDVIKSGCDVCQVCGVDVHLAAIAAEEEVTLIRPDETSDANTTTDKAATAYNGMSFTYWTNIVAVADGRLHTVGLRSDGTVAAVEEDKYDQCNVSCWTDIKLPANTIAVK